MALAKDDMEQIAVHRREAVIFTGYCRGRRGSGKERCFTARRPIFSDTALCRLPLSSLYSHREISRHDLRLPRSLRSGRVTFPLQHNRGFLCVLAISWFCIFFAARLYQSLSASLASCSREPLTSAIRCSVPSKDRGCEMHPLSAGARCCLSETSSLPPWGKRFGTPTLDLTSRF